jgi:hypothetical protein
MKKNKIDSEALRQGFDDLCKKHNLPAAVLVIETAKEKLDKNYTNVELFIGIHSKNKKAEAALATPVKDLFRLTGLNKNALATAAVFMKQESQRQDLYLREKNLSKEDKKRLKQIRAQKNELVKSKKYEEASKLRTEEKKLLGLEEEAPATLDELLNFQPSKEDIENLTTQLQGMLSQFSSKK